jgi:predicted glycoside hydrolase/deacetylase ChbG (UPF0249 family)
VHQLPGIRDVVARVWGNRKGWIRNTATGTASVFGRGVAPLRATVLAAIGAGARRTWQRAGIPTNADFAGVRSFREPSFGALMRMYLSRARPGLLIMCHPGKPDAELAQLDTVTESRVEELAYLSGPDFPADLAAAGCRLVRLSAMGLR